MPEVWTLGKLGLQTATGRQLMALRAGQYRAHAAECEAAALTAPDEKTRAIYLDLAKKWRDLARQVDTLEREPPKR